MDGPVDRPTRIGVSYPAVLVRSNGEEQNVTITNVSADGFSVQGHTGLRAGEQVYLKPDSEGNLKAEIRWAHGANAGGVFFDKPVLP